ncbi:hypothetical protein F2Q70_00033344 [Brassica cretica]|uniref:Autophagy-related protein 11 C-terminal domain-containing protein n=1 Tax=Brassica cretica TaxID=69181 RepID=A0A8S9H758_BRACR|nr:hypothetical protein F2Q70_00033344 [Brassica cretica]KAF2553903.1 hypothetical protein F2Q68_00037655 [Brassica cretica]
MSGSFTDEGKLILCVAENGHSFEFQCSETTSVESVMRFVESVSGISFSDQLLLSLDMKLEPQKLLSTFGLPASDREVFVFNKAMLQSNSHPPSPEDVDLEEVVDALPPAASLHQHHPLDDASDPALKALPSYERQFRYHFLRGRAIYDCTVLKHENCERFAREQKVQQRAVEVATRNLEQYYRVIYQNFLEFMKRYKHQHRLHSDLLMNFGRDVEKLRSVKVHPYLQTDSRKCLLDFVKENKLSLAAESCGSSHRQFENKIAQFQQMFVEVKRKMNCAHLENCLHEAREEAQTHLCAADRRASEYNALRVSSVKIRGLFERFRSSVCTGGGVAGFAESLRNLAQALDNSINDGEDDGTVEFRKCIRVLADKVSFISKHREELLEKCRNLDATIEQTRKELVEKKELVKTLYTKHQLGKQANKEKISFGRLEVHEIAAFVLNQAGHYEAINRNCPNYYLSSESEALFTDHLPNRPTYIVGQIVHIERQAVKQPNLASSSMSTSSSGTTTNPYGLSSGCEYFIVTIAMLPDTSIHQQAS